MITVFAFLEAERNVKLNALKADASKYRPEVYKSEKSKILKTIQKVALGKLLNEMWFFLRSDNYYRRTEGGGGRGAGGGGVRLLVSRLSDRVLQARDGVSQKNRFF